MGKDELSGMRTEQVRKLNDSANEKRTKGWLEPDTKFQIENVSRLTTVCLQVMAQEFVISDSPDFFLDLPLADQWKILELLPEADKLPLEVTLKYIDEESYWQRSCVKKWENEAIKSTNGNDTFKEMYAEFYLQELIETFTPGRDNVKEFLEKAIVLKPHVKCLKLKKLMPPIRVNYGEFTERLSNQIMWRANIKDGSMKKPQDTATSNLGMSYEDAIEELERKVSTGWRKNSGNNVRSNNTTNNTANKNNSNTSPTNNNTSSPAEAPPDPLKKIGLLYKMPKPYINLPRFDSHAKTLSMQLNPFIQGFRYPEKNPPQGDKLNLIKDHFDFQALLPIMTNLQELHVTYSVKEMGMNFEWRLLRQTLGDARILSKALPKSRLKRLNLYRSMIDDERASIIFTALSKHPTLQVLELPQNDISDKACQVAQKNAKR